MPYWKIFIYGYGHDLIRFIQSIVNATHIHVNNSNRFYAWCWNETAEDFYYSSIDHFLTIYSLQSLKHDWAVQYIHYLLLRRCSPQFLVCITNLCFSFENQRFKTSQISHTHIFTTIQLMLIKPEHFWPNKEKQNTR